MSEAYGTSSKAFKLLFGKTGHTAKKFKVNEEEDRPAQEFLTGFAEDGAVFKDRAPASVSVNGSVKRIIPTQGNDFRGLGPRGYNPNRFLPEKGDLAEVGQGEDHFQRADEEVSAPVQYGLSMMGRHKGGGDSISGTAEQARDGTLAEGTTKAPGKRVIGTERDWETDAFKNDIEALPDMSSLEEYEAMPVEMFGEAMLRGMGWSEDKETTKDQAKEFVRRAPLLGLGATQSLQTHKEKRYIRPGESREPRKDMVVYDERGNIKHTKTASDKLVERAVKGPAVGKKMRIIKGRHAGLLCRVSEIQPQKEGRSQTATVTLEPSEEKVSVRLKELGEMTDRAQVSETRTEKQKDKMKGKGPDRRERLDESRLPAEMQKPAIPLGEDRQENGQAETPWLAPHIRVKIVNKHKGGGKLYLKKGVVMDVHSPTHCSILLDSGGTVEAEQADLETAIPKRESSRLLVVAGKLRGQRAKLLQRNSEHSQAAVQLTEDFSICKLSFDEIAEYVGEFGDEE